MAFAVRNRYGRSTSALPERRTHITDRLRRAWRRAELDRTSFCAVLFFDDARNRGFSHTLQCKYRMAVGAPCTAGTDFWQKSFPMEWTRRIRAYTRQENRFSPRVHVGPVSNVHHERINNKPVCAPRRPQSEHALGDRLRFECRAALRQPLQRTTNFPTPHDR